MRTIHICLTCILLGTAVQAADLRLGFLFQDHMVMQREISAPVWGWADPGQQVTVSFAGETQTATADKDGYWIAMFKGLKASDVGRVLRVTDGDQQIERKDVLVGEVWFSAGQSNMARSVGMDCKTFPVVAARIGETDFPDVRYIRFGGTPSREPLKDRTDAGVSWKAMSDETFLNSEAIPFFFGRQLNEDLDVPIGLVQVGVSGTTQTAWASKEVLDRMHEDGISKSFEEWTGKRANLETPKKNEPSVLFNSQIYPFAPFGMRGLIWHQGEAGPQEQHAERMVEMLKSWRQLFGHDFIYLWGGMTRNASKSPPLVPEAQGKFYRHMRNRQFMDAQKLFGYDSTSAFVDFYDLGNGYGHWGQKDIAGMRFAKAALTLAYGQPQNFAGPQKIDASIVPGKATVSFTHVGEGLAYQPSLNGISGFVFYDGKQARWIEPRIESPDTLVFEDPAITPRTGIFYGWGGNPHETLFNSEGLPSSSFMVGKSKQPGGDEGSVVLLDIVKGHKKATLNVLHVRRHVVTCAILPRKLNENTTLRFYLPEEWSGVAVELDGEKVKTGPVTRDEQGRRFMEFEAEANRWSYMLYDPAREAEAREEVDFSRS